MQEALFCIPERRSLRGVREGGAAGGVPPPQRAAPARPAVFGFAKGQRPRPRVDLPSDRRGDYASASGVKPTETGISCQLVPSVR